MLIRDQLFQKDNLFKMHHANILVNNKGDSCHFIYNLLEKDLGFKSHANPDFLLVEVESFGIDDARNLGKWAIGKALLLDIKVCLIKTKSITIEAQNALLKIFEEPTVGTYFFINLESLGGILGTFLSRMNVLNADYSHSDLKDDHKKDAESFLMGNIKERLVLVTALSKKENKNGMRDLIKNLEEVAYKNMASSQQSKKILMSKIYLTSRGASAKMILEWLACVI